MGLNTHPHIEWVLIHRVYLVCLLEGPASPEHGTLLYHVLHLRLRESAVYGRCWRYLVIVAGSEALHRKRGLIYIFSIERVG